MSSSKVILSVALVFVILVNANSEYGVVRQVTTTGNGTTTGNATTTGPAILPNITTYSFSIQYNGTTDAACPICGNATYTCSPDKYWINYTIPDFRVGQFLKYQNIRSITIVSAGVNIAHDNDTILDSTSPSLTFYFIDSLGRSTYLFSQIASADNTTCDANPVCQGVVRPKPTDYQQVSMAPTGQFKVAITTQGFYFCASYVNVNISLGLADQLAGVTNGLGTSSTTENLLLSASSSGTFTPELKIILGVIGALIVLVIIIAIIIVVVRKAREKNQPETNPMIPMNSRPSQIVGDNLYAPISIFKEDLKGVNKIDDIEVLDKLGSGNFGEVYRGVWQGTTFVALKKLSGDLQEFAREASTLMRLNHPNIVRMLGITSSGEYIVTEFMSLGSVDKFLQKRKLNLPDLLSLCHQAASGMNYLEKEKLVHRDLAARNLLVAEEGNKYTVKVADFGLSRTTNEGIYEAQGGQFPIKWSALECLQYRYFTSQSDVWSFGICLWEIFSFGMMPYMAWDNETTVDNIRKGYRLERPEACPPEVYEIMLNCWKVEPSQRPTFRELFDTLFLLHRASETAVDTPQQEQV